MDNFYTSAVLAFAVLFPLVNPVGAMPVFCSLTSGNSSEERKKTALKASVYVLFVLLAFYFIGEFILEFFGISLGVLKIAGGLIVANTAWEMVSGKDKLTSEENREVMEKRDVSFTPIAMPLLSGPGAIGAVIGLSIPGYQASYAFGIAAGIFLTVISVYAALLISLPVTKLIGKTGTGILNKIMGFFILAIAVQLIVSGINMLYSK